DSISGGHAQGTADQIGAQVVGVALAGSTSTGAGQTLAAGTGTLRLHRKPGPLAQRARDASAQVAGTAAATQRVAAAQKESGAGRIAVVPGPGQGTGRSSF